MASGERWDHRSAGNLSLALGNALLDRHRSYHKAFRVWLAGVTDAHRAGGDSATARRDIHSYLRVWLANHVLVYDKAYAPWLKRRAGGAGPARAQAIAGPERRAFHAD